MLEDQLAAEYFRRDAFLHAAGNGMHCGMVLFLHRHRIEFAFDCVCLLQRADAGGVLAVYYAADAVFGHAARRHAAQQPFDPVRVCKAHAAGRPDHHRGAAVPAAACAAAACAAGTAAGRARAAGGNLRYVGLACNGTGVPHLRAAGRAPRRARGRKRILTFFCEQNIIKTEIPQTTLPSQRRLGDFGGDVF